MKEINYKNKKLKLPYDLKAGETSTELVTRQNPFSGQSSELPEFAAVVYDKTIEFLCSKKLSYNLTPQPDFPDIEILGSWKFHYISWRDGVPNMPKIIIRYEDLIKDSYSCFYKIINFLSKILNFKLDEEQIKFSVENSKFEKLQNNENKFGYIKNNSNTNFFHSGKIQQWKNILNKSQIKTIENKFKEEMKLLGYL